MQELKHPGYIPDRDNANEVKQLREARRFEMYLPFVNLEGIPINFHDPYLEFLKRSFDQHSQGPLDFVQVWEPGGCRVWGAGTSFKDALSILKSIDFPAPVSLKLRASGFLGNSYHLWTEVETNGISIITDPAGTGIYPAWNDKDREFLKPHFGLIDKAPLESIETYRSGKTIPKLLHWFSPIL